MTSPENSPPEPPGSMATPETISSNRSVPPSADAQAILESMLMPGEKIMALAAISNGIYWKGIVLFIVSFVIIFMAFALGAFLMFVSLLMLSIAYLTKYYLLLGATNKRIIIRSGIVNFDVIQLRYSKIESVELAWTIMGQIFRYASVVITGTGRRVVVIPFVSNAAEFRGIISEILMRKEEAMEEAGGGDN
jgi:hypothetical protein